MRRLLMVLAALGLVGCGNGPNNNTGGGGGSTGGGAGGGGGALSRYQLVTLDPDAKDAVGLAMAVDPATERVGVVYFTNLGTRIYAGPDGGSGPPDYAIKYVEYRQGVITGPEQVRPSAGAATPVENLFGLALVFAPNGDPVISYLGGQYDHVISVSWFENDAVVTRRSGGVWTEQVVVRNSGEVTGPSPGGDSCGNNVSVAGFLVGLWPAIGFDGTGKLVLVYRDGHQGEFDKQDWAGSDVESMTGTFNATAPWMTGLTPACVKQGGKDKQGYGGHIKLVTVGGQPAITYDRMPLDPGSGGSDVVFQRRDGTGTWSAPSTVITIANTQSGPSLAYDATEGFGVAVVDASTSQLWYQRFTDPQHPPSPDPVYGSGSGGWYPSLAMDPVHHEPAIAYYFCSSAAHVNETQCTTDQNELRVTQRVLGNWQEDVVDTGGGYLPQLAFFASGKKVMAYRQPVAKDPGTGQPAPGAGILKLAVER